MEKEQASLILDSILSLGDHLNRLDSLIRQIPEENERRRFLVALGNVMVTLTTDMMMPIIHRYPELDPDA
jgi:hypothetical protein